MSILIYVIYIYFFKNRFMYFYQVHERNTRDFLHSGMKQTQHLESLETQLLSQVMRPSPLAVQTTTAVCEHVGAILAAPRFCKARLSMLYRLYPTILFLSMCHAMCVRSMNAKVHQSRPNPSYPGSSKKQPSTKKFQHAPEAPEPPVSMLLITISHSPQQESLSF